MAKAYSEVRNVVREAMGNRSLELDKTRTKNYWSTNVEMTARAFEAYVKYKIDSQGFSNDYLANIVGEEVYNALGRGNAYPYPTKAEMPKIAKAFDNFFNTIKTRETDKGIELYYLKKDLENVNDFLFNGKLYNGKIGKITIKDLAVKNKDLIDLVESGKGDIPIHFKDINETNVGGGFDFENNEIIIDKYSYDEETALHELQHARDYEPKYYKLAKQAVELAGKVKDFRENNKRLEAIISDWKKYKKKNPNIKDFENTLSASDLYIVGTYKKLYNKYANQIFERRAMQAGKGIKITKSIAEELQEIKENNPEEWREYNYDDILDTKQSLQGIWRGTDSRPTDSQGKENAEAQSTTANQIKKEIADNDYSKIESKTRDKVYKWHGDIEKNRYDVDKALNSFVNTSKGIAKEYSKKFGMKVTDKLVRETLPFLRERTGIPEKLDRKDIKEFYRKLTPADKQRLTKFADDVSDKFEKYYVDYKAAKGEPDAELLENHISHIWDLDKKHKFLMTNYITTNSRFAKERTIKTLLDGIDGVKIDGKTVYFKPKTLDYAEILKTSSDNLIKATADSNLAKQIKNLEYNGEKLVLPASKASEDWVEINHPAINKAVYMGEIGDDKLPMLMKSPVKIHPAAAKYLSAVFEVQKPDNIIARAYDVANGLVKQTTLGFSGFHGYALSESAASNVGLKNAAKKALNFKDFYNAVKNNEYDVYKQDTLAKQALEDGLQLGTPQIDTNRNIVEDFIGKIPVVGKVLSEATKANNKILWDVLHNNYKLQAYKIALDNIDGTPTVEQRRAIAQWVNDSFGGQAWELLGIKRSTVKALSRVLLSPDWNFSTIRQTMGLFNNAKTDSALVNMDTPFWKNVKDAARLLGVTEEPGAKGVRGKNAANFFLRFAIYTGVIFNVINASFREKDREEHPELYPQDMTPFDYSIWANISPNENIFDKIFPYVFIGRNSDGTARYLRVGKQVREVPEFALKPVEKISGKTSGLLNLISQTALGMSPADVIKQASGRYDDVYYNQNIWNGYGKYATRKEGKELAAGMGKTMLKSVAPFIANKVLDEKHEFSAWDFVAQTSKGLTFRKTYKQMYQSFDKGNAKDIEYIRNKARLDGMNANAIKEAQSKAEQDFRAKYRAKYKRAITNQNKSEIKSITNELKNKNYKDEYIQKIYSKAYENVIKKQKEQNRKKGI